MSLEASAYALNLDQCEDGAELSQSQKFLLVALANFHNTSQRTAWPSLPTLARICKCSEDSVRRALAYLEEHCTVEAVKPTRQGRGKHTEYILLAVDRRELLGKKLQALVSGKGSHGATLFCGEERVAEGSQKQSERVAEGSQKQSERVAEGSQNAIAIRKEKEQEQKEQEQKEHHADGVSDSTEAISSTQQPNPHTHGKPLGLALAKWIEIKSQLRLKLGEGVWRDYIRPLYLLWLMSDNTLQIVMPRSSRFQTELRGRLPDIRRVAAAHGYAIALSWYPDEYEMKRMQAEYPDIFAQWMDAVKDGKR